MMGSTERRSVPVVPVRSAVAAETRWTSGLRLAGSGTTSLMSSPRTSAPLGGDVGVEVGWWVGAAGALWWVEALPAGVPEAGPDPVLDGPEGPDEPPPEEPAAGVGVVWVVVVGVVLVVVV